MEINELLKINESEYTFTKEKIEEFKKPFYPLAENFIKELPNIEKIILEYKKWYTPELWARAKRCKLDIAKIRNNTKDLKDKEKSSFLQVWNLIQACHNVIVKTIEEKEDELEIIIKYEENLRIQKIKDLQNEREELLKQYNVDNISTLRLWEMEDIVFNNFLEWTKKAYNDKIEFEKKQSEEKEKQEKIEKIYNNRRLEIAQYSYIINDDLKFDLLKETSEEEYHIYLNKLKEAKKEDDYKREKQQKEIDRLNKELEEEEKKKQKLEDEKRVKEESEKQQKEEKARIEKETRYKDFLNAFNVTKEKIDNKEMKIVSENWKVIIYKKIAEFII